MRNGISATGLSELTAEIQSNPSQGIASYGVAVRWLSGTRAEARALPMRVGDQAVNRDFSWIIDEPKQLGGTNYGPNPQEYLLSGMGACVMVGFAVGASVMGIQLSQLEVEVRSALDLAGFLEARDGAKIPMSGIQYIIRVAGDGTPEQFQMLREKAVAHSPNAMSLKHGVPVTGELIIL